MSKLKQSSVTFSFQRGKEISVVSKFFYSQFFRHATAVNLKEGFEKSAYELPKGPVVANNIHGWIERKLVVILFKI